MKYIAKNNLKEEMEIYNTSKLAKKIGICRQYFQNIINQKTTCSKMTAYCITKIINNNEEIETYFERM